MILESDENEGKKDMLISAFGKLASEWITLREA